MADSSTIVISDLKEFEKKLEQLKTDSPGFEKRLRGVIRKVMGRARANLRNSAAKGLNMRSDPRHAYKAVRYAVYKRIFGGQLNLFSSRRAGAETGYQAPRKGSAGRGGNRRPRVSRNLDKYEGVDRGFILRWLNSGTNPRAIRFVESDRRRVDKWNRHPNTGNRSHIQARHWFEGASQRELQDVAGWMQDLIDKIIKEEFM